MTTSFKELLVNLGEKTIELDILNLCSFLFIGFSLSLVLRWFFLKYGKTNSNRKAIADIFPLLVVCVTVIIFTIKSSIALSLGLVGALSIVRFRAAIKEPEELVYLFFAITIGLGLGAGQVYPTLVTFVLTLPVIYLKHRFFDVKNIEKKVYINLKVENKKNGNDYISNWSNILSKSVNEIEMHRIDKDKNSISATFQVEIPNIKIMEDISLLLDSIGEETEITIIDNSNPMLLN